jgi:translation initiation factor IF-1
MKSDVIVIEGEVIENLPNTLFRVRITPKEGVQEEGNEKIIICYLSGKMRKNYIKILPGDKVRIEITPYDLDRGRIIFRK